MYMKEIIVAHTQKRILSDKMLYLHAFSLYCLSKFYVFLYEQPLLHTSHCKMRINKFWKTQNAFSCTAQYVTLNEHRTTMDL